MDNFNPNFSDEPPDVQSSAKQLENLKETVMWQDIARYIEWIAGNALEDLSNAVEFGDMRHLQGRISVFDDIFKLPDDLIIATEVDDDDN